MEGPPLFHIFPHLSPQSVMEVTQFFCMYIFQLLVPLNSFKEFLLQIKFWRFLGGLAMEGQALHGDEEVILPICCRHF